MFFWYIWQTYSTGITNVELEQPASLKDTMRKVWVHAAFS